MKESIILTGKVGSHSYGTATSESDLDLMSLVVAPTDVYLGLSNWGNAGTKKREYEENGTLVEHQYFEIKKAISLCAAFNPNIIPLLWLEWYESISPEGHMLLDNRTLFNSKRAYHTFRGYAHGQLQKMGGVFNDAEEDNKKLKKGYERFIESASEEITDQRSLRELNAIVDPPIQAAFYVYEEGYLNAMIALRTHAQEEVKRIKDGPITGRLGAKRKRLRDKYGFDTSFAAHTIRLMRMCVEFLEHPEEGLKVNRVDIDAEELYGIRVGKLGQEEIKKMADELFEQAKDLVKTTDLPDEPEHEKINDLTMNILKSALS